MTNLWSKDEDGTLIARTDEVKVIKTDTVGGVTYIGRANYLRDRPRGIVSVVAPSESAAVWQIQRLSTSGSVQTKEFANGGKYDRVWTQRTSYFAPVPFSNTKSIVFDGSNDYVTVPHHASLNFGRLQPFSFSAWVKSLAPTTKSTLAEKFTGGFGYEIYHDTSGRVEVNFQGGGAGNRIRRRNDTTTLADGLWHHVAVTYNGSSAAAGMLVYVDGSSAGNTTLNDTLTVDPTSLAALVFAASSTGGTPRLTGFMDEVALWNVALTPAAVLELFNGDAKTDLEANIGNYTQSLSLVSWWRMGDGDTYPTITDNKDANHGTLTNAVPGSITSEVP